MPQSCYLRRNLATGRVVMHQLAALRLSGREPVKLSPASGFGSVVAAVTVMLALVPSAMATATAPAGTVAGLGGPDTLRFTFNGHQSLKSGTRVVDATGHGHYGVVRTSGAGHLTVLKNGVKGTRAAGFPRACTGCGKAIITVASRPALNPGKQAFAFGASVRATPKQAPPGRDPNIVAKGYPHHKFKLHLLGAKPRCVFEGLKNDVTITSTEPINDGAWHRVVCARDGNLHRLFVDGKLKASSATTYSGPIASKRPIKVGGRAVGLAGKNDQFHGDLDNVFLHIGK